MEQGQRCLASCLSQIIEEINTEDQDSLLEGLGELFSVIWQVRNRPSGSGDVSVFDARPVSPFEMEAPPVSSNSPIIINKSSEDLRSVVSYADVPESECDAPYAYSDISN